MTNDAGYRLFIDDERMPPSDGTTWIVVRSYDSAVDLIKTIGVPQFISFDHDLGDEKTGYDIAKWLCDFIQQNGIDPSAFTYYVHSQNPVGKRNIESYLDSFLSFMKNNA